VDVDMCLVGWRMALDGEKRSVCSCGVLLATRGLWYVGCVHTLRGETARADLERTPGVTGSAFFLSLFYFKPWKGFLPQGSTLSRSGEL